MKARKINRGTHSSVKRLLACALLAMFAATWGMSLFIPRVVDIAIKISPLIPLLIPVAVYYFKTD